MKGLRQICAAVLSCAWVIETGGVTALAEPVRKVTVSAEGIAPFLRDMSPNEVRNEARDEACRSAIEQAGGFVRGNSVLHNAQIVDELIASVYRA